MEWFEMIAANNVEAASRNRQFLGWLKQVQTELEGKYPEVIVEMDAPAGDVFVLRTGARVYIPDLSEKPYTLAHLHMDLFTPVQAAKNIVSTLKRKK